ncbi:hypothetical protein EAN92_30065 [Klebsiella pneumoniae]|nr:hypothetical protein EAN92_30065 [Klebsiella pneumoniae]
MEGKGLFKYSLISLLLGIIPIIIIFFIHFSNESSHIISYLFDIANGYQRFSEQYLAVSTIASAYTKTAPFFVILMYIICWNKFDIKTIKLDLKRWLKLLPGVLLLTAGAYYLTYVGVENMSDSMYRIKRIIAENEYFLLIYYILLFLTNYFFIWLLLIYLYLLKRSAFFSKAEITSALH